MSPCICLLDIDELQELSNILWVSNHHEMPTYHMADLGPRQRKLQLRSESGRDFSHGSVRQGFLCVPSPQDTFNPDFSKFSK